MSEAYPYHLAVFLEIEIVKQMLRQLAQRCPGGRLPDNYVVVDSETTGVNVGADKVLQWGYCLVKDRKPVDSASFYLKRGRDVVIPKEATKVHGITHELLEAEGEDPKEVVTTLIDALNHFRRQNYMIAGHNLLAFDARLLEKEAKEFGLDFTFNTQSPVILSTIL